MIKVENKNKKIKHADLGGRIVAVIVINTLFIIWQLIMFTFFTNAFWGIKAIVITILIIDLLIIIFGKVIIDFFTELLSWI